AFLLFLCPLFASACQVVCRGVEREVVARDSEAGNRPNCDVGEVRALSKLFAPRDVRQVQLDERDAHREQRVAQRDAGVCESRRIEEDQRRLIVSGSMNAANQLRLRIALVSDELVSERAGAILQLIFYSRQRGGAIDARSRVPSSPRFGPFRRSSRAIRT